MAQQRSIPKHRGDGGETTITIRSHSRPNVKHEVNLDAPRSCSCEHHSATGARCRHILEALSVQRIRKSPFSVRRDEETAREIVAKVLDRRNGYPESYSAMLDAFHFRFATTELRQISQKRHVENVKRFKGAA